jgi:hypothetical protein
MKRRDAKDILKERLTMTDKQIEEKIREVVEDVVHLTNAQWEIKYGEGITYNMILMNLHTQALADQRTQLIQATKKYKKETKRKVMAADTITKAQKYLYIQGMEEGLDELIKLIEGKK